jgi:hypothetical protein
VRPQSPSDCSGMVVAMPDRVIFEQELACERRAGIERHRSCPSQFFLVQCAYGSRSRRTVALEQVQSGFPRDRRELCGVPRVHRVDVLHRQVRYRSPLSDGRLRRFAPGEFLLGKRLLRDARRLRPFVRLRVPRSATARPSENGQAHRARAHPVQADQPTCQQWMPTVVRPPHRYTIPFLSSTEPRTIKSANCAVALGLAHSNSTVGAPILTMRQRPFSLAVRLWVWRGCSRVHTVCPSVRSAEGRDGC